MGSRIEAYWFMRGASVLTVLPSLVTTNDATVDSRCGSWRTSAPLKVTVYAPSVALCPRDRVASFDVRIVLLTAIETRTTTAPAWTTYEAKRRRPRTSCP